MDETPATITVAVEAIRRRYDPFRDNSWGCGPISPEAVRAALREGRLDARPWDAVAPTLTAATPLAVDRRYHVERIAYLVAHPDAEPIVITLDGADDFAWGFNVQDGNHRLAAAIIRGDLAIPVEDDTEDGRYLAELALLFRAAPEHDAPGPVTAPRRVTAYHGTKRAFARFDPERSETEYGCFFADRPERAAEYADGPGGRIVEVVLEMANPFVCSAADWISGEAPDPREVAAAGVCDGYVIDGLDGGTAYIGWFPDRMTPVREVARHGTEAFAALRRAGRALTEPNTADGPAVRIVATPTPTGSLLLDAAVDGVSVGYALFAPQETGAVVCLDVFVDEGMRRRGIGSAFYAAAERHYERPVLPSSQLTPDSVAFWTARGVAVPPDADVRPYGDWHPAEHEARDGPPAPAR